MTKRSRNFLFLFFILLFIIIAPLSIFYATGYKLNLSWPITLNSALQKTGMLVIETEPRGATIYLNEETQQLFRDKILLKKENIIQTPLKIKGLLPGEYDVRLELDGYWPWQRKTTIHPGLATIQENIQLFKKSLPLQVMDLSMDELSRDGQLLISPDHNFISCIINNEVKILNNKNAEIQKIKINESDLNNNLIWSNDSYKLLAGTNIIDSQKNFENTNLEKIISSGIYNLKWDDNNSSKIYYQLNNSLNLYDLDRGKSNTLLNNLKIKDYLVSGDSIILIGQEEESLKLQNFSITDGVVTQKIDLPYSSSYQILKKNSRYIHLYDKDHKILYLLDLYSNFSPLKEIVSNVDYVVWANDDLMLYGNNYEIWLLELNSDSIFEGKNEKTLLTRISQPITNIAWHPSNNHILYSTEKSINLIDLSNTEKKNLTELIALENICNTIFLPNENLVYFGARIGNQEGIYKLEL